MNKQYIFIGLSVVILVASILLSVKPNLDKKKELDSQITELTTRYNDLQAKEANRPMYEAGITENEAKYQETLAKFPEDISQDKYIMFFEDAEQNEDLKDVYFTTYDMAEKQLFYTLGSGGSITTAAGDVTASQGDTTAAPASTEAAATDPNAVAPVADANSDQGYESTLTIGYEGPYSGIKNFLALVNSFPERMTISEMDLTYDSEIQKLSGSFKFNIFAVAGPGRILDDVAIDGVDLKPSDKNIFDSADKSDNSVKSDYAVDDGSDILQNYDHFVMLNPLGADQAAIIIGKNNDSAKESYISSNENTVQNITINYFMKGDKYFVSYNVGDTKYPEDYDSGVEFEPSGDSLALAVMSSERKNDKDLSGVRASIINSTDLPLYVKVDSDDTANARFRIASREGKVIVK